MPLTASAQRSKKLDELFERMQALPKLEFDAVMVMSFGGAQGHIEAKPRAGLSCYFEIVERHVAMFERRRPALNSQPSTLNPA